jgi:hypothetical protein
MGSTPIPVINVAMFCVYRAEALLSSDDPYGPTSYHNVDLVKSV